MLALPPEEAPAHGLDALRSALVREGDDPGLTAGPRGKDGVAGVVTESRDRMRCDGLRELGVSVLGEPPRSCRAVGLVATLIGLVDVMEEGRALHQAAIDWDAAPFRPLGQEGGNLRDGRHVSQQTRRRLEP